MKLIGFVKFYNEEINDNLERCLKEMTQYTDGIVCCNDSSNDNSLEIAKKYTNKIITMPNDFRDELLHKQKLLEYLFKEYPKCTHIIHLDPDECLTKPNTIRILCSEMINNNLDGIRIHLINLWLSKYWYRIDDQFNGLWKTILWRNNDKLKYPDKKELHHPMHPQGIERVGQVPENSLQIIHYGFSTPELIARKYKTYQSLGQSGWNLERLKPTREPKLLPLISGYNKPVRLTEEKWRKCLSQIKI